MSGPSPQGEPKSTGPSQPTAPKSRPQSPSLVKAVTARAPLPPRACSPGVEPGSSRTGSTSPRRNVQTVGAPQSSLEDLLEARSEVVPPPVPTTPRGTDRARAEDAKRIRLAAPPRQAIELGIDAESVGVEAVPVRTHSQRSIWPNDEPHWCSDCNDQFQPYSEVTQCPMVSSRGRSLMDAAECRCYAVLHVDCLQRHLDSHHGTASAATRRPR